MPDLDTLIARLETAEAGSRELDFEIAIQAKIVPDGFTLDDNGEWRDRDGYVRRTWMCPRFSESLDASIPGEDIVTVVQWNGGPWTAWTRTGKRGIGHTEALARRIAALRARQAATEARGD